MHTDRRVAGARPAGDEGDARLAGQLAIGLGHVDGAGLEAAGHQLDPVALGIEAVEQVEIALARHAEGVGHALCHQRIGQDMPAEPRLAPRCLRHRFRSRPVTACRGGP